MQHLDDDDLIMLALEELPETSLVTDHLAHCTSCQEDLRSWQITVGTAREADAELGPEPAPAHVWDAIRAEISTTAQLPRPDVVELPSAQAAGAPWSPTDERPTDHTVADLADYRAPDRPARRRWTAPLIAAAAAAVISGVVVYFAVRPATEPAPPAAQVEAIAQLAPIDDPAAAGTLGRAELVRSDNGVNWLQVQVADLPAIPGSYEVWLLGADGRMVSLGVLAAGSGNFAVPQGIDLATYPIVDISNEPADGNPAHSKNSVARGELT